MKKIKNKFIILIIFIIWLIIWLQLLLSFYLNKVDRSSYAVLLEWKWSMNKLSLEVENRRVISNNSTIKSIWNDSIVIIEWWDGSITRLWWNTEIFVKESDINNTLSEIKIDFNLLSWKSWSNVISFLWKDSYFNESFDELEAWVRWTVFNVDLDKWYINVLNHEIKLTNKTWEVFIITEEKPFSLKSLSFIDLKVFLTSIKDEAWEKYNFTIDNDYLETLKNDLSTSVDKSNPFLFLMRFFSTKYSILYNIYNLKSFDIISKQIESIDAKWKNYLYGKVLSKYQNVHFSRWNDKELFTKKLYYKKLLILLADKKNKTYLVKNSLFDIEDILNLKDKELLKDVLLIFQDNKEFIKEINLDFSWYFDNIKWEIFELLWDNFNLDSIPSSSIWWINNKVLDTAKNLKNSIEWEINNQLNSLIGK